MATPQAMTALEALINRWTQIAGGSLPDTGAADNALCQLYNNSTPKRIKPGESDCSRECPIANYMRRGGDGCQGTPYEAWRYVSKASEPGSKTPASLEELKAAARYLDFLVVVRDWELMGQPY